MPWGAIAAAAAPFVAKAIGGRGKRLNLSKIHARYRAERPVGYLTDADHAASERMRGRAGQTAGKFGEDQRAMLLRRSVARGTSRSPALERSQGRIAQQEGAMLESAAGRSEDFLYGTMRDRESFERQRLMTAWGADIGAAQGNFQRDAARESSFWNSINQYIPALSGMFGGGVPGTDVSGPATPLIDELPWPTA